MNAFAQYAETAAPTPAAKRRINPKTGGIDALTGLDAKLEEKQRLSRSYRAARAADMKRTIALEPRLLDFARYLRSIKAGDGDELVQAVAGSWLMQAPQVVRLLALQMVQRRCDRINRSLGNRALDDPLPPETSVFLQVQSVLRRGGVL